MPQLMTPEVEDGCVLGDRTSRDRDWCLAYMDGHGVPTVRLQFRSSLTRRELLGKLAIPEASLQDGCVVLCRGNWAETPEAAWQPEWHYCRHAWNDAIE